MNGTKFDKGKPDWSLLPMDMVEQVVRVLDMGAAKYGKNNWQKFPDTRDAQARYYSAMLRHITQWQAGEDCDKESGLPHMAHVACNALFLLWYEKNSEE